MTTLTAILTYVFGTRLLLYLNAVELAPILWLFPVYVFLMGYNFLLDFGTRVKNNLRSMLQAVFWVAFPISMAEIAGGWVGFRTGENLVVIRIFGLIFAPAFFVWRLLRGDAGFIIRNINHRRNT